MYYKLGQVIQIGAKFITNWGTTPQALLGCQVLNTFLNSSIVNEVLRIVVLHLLISEVCFLKVFY